MHEQSLVRALLSQVREACLPLPSSDAEEVVVSIGPLAGVEPLLVESAFELLKCESDLAAARQERRNAEREYESLQRLAGKKAATGQEVAAARQRLEKADLDIKALESRRGALVAPSDREVAQAQRDNFRAAHRAGVRMVFGSDAGVMPHGTAAGQFRYMVEYGMTPMEAIQAATRNGALALGRENDVGAIAVGRYADIVAVDGDPLADVRQLESVDVVIKSGDLVSDRRGAAPPTASR